MKTQNIILLASSFLLTGGVNLLAHTDANQGFSNKIADERFQAPKPVTDQFEAVQPTDKQLVQRLETAIKDDQNFSTNVNNVKFSVDKDVVTLSGTVPSDQVKTDLENKVKGVDGVKSVEDNLVVSPSANADQTKTITPKPTVPQYEK